MAISTKPVANFSQSVDKQLMRGQLFHPRLKQRWNYYVPYRKIENWNLAACSGCKLRRANCQSILEHSIKTAFGLTVTNWLIQSMNSCYCSWACDNNLYFFLEKVCKQCERVNTSVKTMPNDPFALFMCQTAGNCNKSYWRMEREEWRSEIGLAPENSEIVLPFSELKREGLHSLHTLTSWYLNW